MGNGRNGLDGLNRLGGRRGGEWFGSRFDFGHGGSFSGGGLGGRFYWSAPEQEERSEVGYFSLIGLGEVERLGRNSASGNGSVLVGSDFTSQPHTR